MANQALLALVYSSDWAGIVDPDGLNIRPRYVYWSHISSGEPFMKSFKFEKCFDPRPLMLKIITLVFLILTGSPRLSKKIDVRFIEF